MGALLLLNDGNGNGDRLVVANRRLALTGKMRQSVRWLSGKDPNEDIDSGLNNSEGSSSDENSESEDGSKHKRALLAIEPEEELAEETSRASKKSPKDKKKKKKKKKKKRKKRRDTAEDIVSDPNDSDCSGKA